MTTHVICLTGTNDSYIPDLAQEDLLLAVPFNAPGHPAAIQNTLVEIFERYSIVPSLAALDLLCAAIAAYTGDLRAPRTAGYDQWTRDFILHLAVHDRARWEEGRVILADLLSFLTGDHWEVVVRPTTTPLLSIKSASDKSHRSDTAVCLFSGGLDSFLGAIDILASEGRAVLVGHHSAGGGATSVSQTRAIAAVRTAFSEHYSPFIQTWISPPKGRHRASETTTRGRSILFLGLGIAVADGLRIHRLVVPENGFISLNVPLTLARLGSFSTRTTHPHLMSLLRQLLTVLGIEVSISLPYQFSTKGEMIAQCLRQDLLSSGLAATMSCSHPSVGRFEGERNPHRHCGYCVPCIIRQAAISTVMPDSTAYTYSDLHVPLSPRRASDLRAFRLMLDRYAQRAPRLADVLSAGPLPKNEEELQRFLGVFRRGIDEVRRFLM